LVFVAYSWRFWDYPGKARYCSVGDWLNPGLFTDLSRFPDAQPRSIA